MMVMVLSGEVDPSSYIAVEDRVQVSALESIMKRMEVMAGMACPRM
jgi:hypothetical protein